MKVLHLCFVGPYNEGWTYQENLLSKYHARLGHEVTLVCTPREIVKGEIKLSKDKEYINDDGVHVVRMPEKINLGNKLIWYQGVKEILEQTEPDILFVHGPQFMDASIVANYVMEHSKVRMYVDNHSDFTNSATNFISKNILHKFFWRRCSQILEPVTEKFFGVLPARVDFLKEVYKLPKKKCELLVMGADDEQIEKASKEEVREAVRRRYGIEEQDFLVMTGGKINRFRPETLDLMRAVSELKYSHVKLLIFGMVEEALKKEFDALCDNKKIIYAGWQDSSKTFDFFAAADLVVFPGLHSVMWEQAVAQGIPCIFRKIQGFDHVDIGGNAHLLEDVSVDSLKKEIMNILDNSVEYQHMKKVAKDKGMKVFSYREIAKKSIGLN